MEGEPGTPGEDGGPGAKGATVSRLLLLPLLLLRISGSFCFPSSASSSLAEDYGMDGNADVTAGLLISCVSRVKRENKDQWAQQDLQASW